MDAPWTYEAWKPTHRTADKGSLTLPVWQLPSRHDVEKHRKQLELRAWRVMCLPHNPLFRLQRAETLSALGFPELVAGDCYMAILLFDAGISNSTPLGESVFFHYGMNYWFNHQSLRLWALESDETVARTAVTRSMECVRRDAYLLLIHALNLLRALPDSHQICHEALEKYPNDALFKRELTYTEQCFSSMGQRSLQQHVTSDTTLQWFTWATSLSHVYPWASMVVQTRDETMIAEANKVMEECSSDLEIRVIPGSTSKDGPTRLGVFATRLILKDEMVLDCPSAIGISNSQAKDHCYNCTKMIGFSPSEHFPCCPEMKFCSEECKDLAEAHYHKVLCGKDFSDLFDIRGAPGRTTVDMNALMFLRILAILVQDGGHPLQHPAIAWMTPQTTDFGASWALKSHVIAPLRILETLGVDIFNDKYDFWVLQTIWNRVVNNKKGDTDGSFESEYLNPMYSFFNHSCNRNTLDSPFHDSHTTSRSALWAARDIQEDEEVFVSYVGGDLTQIPRAKRWELLKYWVGSEGCWCETCKNEG